MNQRSARTLAAVLAGVLVVVMALALAMLGGDPEVPPSPSPPAPSPTPATSPSPSPPPAPPAPSPTPAAQISPSPSPPAPSPTPATSPSPSPPQPSPAVSPTASPEPVPPVSQRQLRVLDLGLDRPGLEEASPRFVTLDVDGPGSIEVALTRVSAGRVRVCTWRGTPSDAADRQCQNVRRGSFERQVPEAGRSTWTVSLIGADAQFSPTVTLELRFAADDPRVSLAHFRFQGQEIDNYNGFTLEVEARATGTLIIEATIDDGEGGTYPYSLVVARPGSGEPPIEEEGTGGAVRLEVVASAGQSYRATMENRQTVADAEVLLHALIRWP